ncbi:hypothetical protein SAMN04489806_1122 [Paramicrobacterium humi]|uniref:Uncharacterized protein n=1 Tax=Paramicrobacterium humi TaxID=640635 RepID=A0A1H4KEQ7_9MICO|nr:hypothetical protein [Microbacterium humi]SEB56548.1 hypothetical protein SAMN04489806_1122 [Microbacterium humi]
MVITQADYIAHEAAALRDALTRGDEDDARETAATLRHELHSLLQTFDPEGTQEPRVTMVRGRYVYPDHTGLPDNVSPLWRGPYADAPSAESDVLDEEWISTLDPDKHRLFPKPGEED